SVMIVKLLKALDVRIVVHHPFYHLIAFSFFDWEIIRQVLIRPVVENRRIKTQYRKSRLIDISRWEIDSKSSRHKLESNDYNDQQHQTYILLFIKINTEKNKVEQQDYRDSESDESSYEVAVWRNLGTIVYQEASDSNEKNDVFQR